MDLAQYIEAPTEQDYQLAADIQRRAVHLLSLREHGSKDLEQKLKQTFPQTENLPGLIDFVIAVCRENNWLSDERFIESYIRQATEKGHGPYKIRQALSLKTTAEDLISAYLDLDDDEWVDIAQAVLIKKYGDASRPQQAKELAKRMRFLQSRGFSQTQINRALKH